VDASQSDQVITSSIYLSQCEYLKHQATQQIFKKPSSYYDDEYLDNEKLVFNNTLTIAPFLLGSFIINTWFRSKWDGLKIGPICFGLML